MLEWSAYIKFFVALMVIVNPVGTIPIFVILSDSSHAADRKRIARVAATTVAVVLIVAALIGEFLLRLFGITIPSFKVGGGILILLMAVAMMQASPPREKQTPEEAKEAVDKASIAVVPLAVPLLAGPGAISTTIIFATERASFGHYAALFVCCLLVALLTWIALRVATPVSSLIGRTGINIAVRLMGLLLAAVAIEILVDGLKVLLPGLA